MVPYAHTIYFLITLECTLSFATTFFEYILSLHGGKPYAYLF